MRFKRTGDKPLKTKPGKPIMRIEPHTQHKRYFASITQAAFDLAEERTAYRAQYDVYWTKSQDARVLIGNISNGANAPKLAKRYGYFWRYVTEAEALANGADCI